MDQSGNHKHMAVLRPIAAAAHITGRHRTLIHSWIRTGQLTTVRDPHTRQTLVDLVEVAQLSARTPRRRPRSLTPQGA